MKILNINFNWNNTPKNNAPKEQHNGLSPLAFDTISFSNASFREKPKNVKYSVYQKQEEINAVKAAINGAIQTSSILSAEELSEKTGLDIYVVKLRLSTSNEIRQLYNDMKLANSTRIKEENQIKAQTAEGFLEMLNKTNQKLTDNEIAFYLGLKKDELLRLISEYPSLGSLYGDALLKIKSCPVLERKAQITSINSALRHIGKKDTYDSISKRAELTPEIIRVRVNENNALFERLIESRVYPPEIYSDEAIEKQDDILMDTMLNILKRKEQASIKDMAQQAGLYPGTVMIRIKNNTALFETYQRILGIDKDEDWD